jgi:hypothetical protein
MDSPNDSIVVLPTPPSSPISIIVPPTPPPTPVSRILIDFA